MLDNSISDEMIMSDLDLEDIAVDGVPNVIDDLASVQVQSGKPVVPRTVTLLIGEDVLDSLLFKERLIAKVRGK